MVSKNDFFAEHYAYAREAGLSDVQARLAVSQAAVETGWGKVGQAVKGNNYFGMKVGDDWTGKSINLPTREETKQGKSYTEPADFRQYETPVDAYRDWGAMMTKNWPDVMKAKTFDEAVVGLEHGVKGVYATENDYGKSLKSVNRDLEKSGIPAQMAAAAPAAAAPSDFDGLLGGKPTAYAGRPGMAYSDLVAPTAVKTTAVKATQPPGLAALAPHGLLGQMTNRDETVLASLHPDYREQARSFLAETKARGLNIGLVPTTGGYRTKAQQAAIKATGTIAASPSNSYHNYGLGFDYAPLDANNNPSWDKTDPRWDQAGQIATDLGMQRSIEGDLGHVTPAGFPDRVPGSIKAAKQFTDPTSGLSYPSLDDQQSFAVAGANPYARMAQSLQDNAALAKEQEAPAVADSGFAPGLTPASYAPQDQPAAGMFGTPDAAPSAPTAAASPYSDGITAMDVASQAVNAPVDTMGGVGTAATQGALGGFLGQQAKQGLGAFYGAPDASVAPQSLTPDRQMPGGILGQANLASVPAAAPSMSPQLTAAAPLGPPTGLDQQTAALQQQHTIAPFSAAPAQQAAPQPSSPTIASPDSNTYPDAPRPETTFPDAPTPPTREESFKAALGPSLAKAGVGFLTGGPIGAAVGLLGGLAGNKMGGMFGNLGPGFDGAVPSGDRFSTGSGLSGINAAMGGARGAQGFSRSNPGQSYTSLGPGMGGLRRSDRFGWTEHVNDAGAVTGISYDNPGQGGLLGSLSRSVGGMFGGRGGGLSARGRDSVSKGKGGLY